MSAPRILSVEDDPQTIALYRRHYADKGWPFHASQGCDLFAVLETFKPTVLLVDLRLNGKQGHELVRELRRSSYRELPVIMVSGMCSTEAVNLGLAAGADLFIKKPVTPAELDAHIESLLRRVSGTFANYDDGTLSIHLVHRQVKVKGARVSLAPTEWFLLTSLLRSPVPVCKEKLIEEIWGEAKVAANALEKAVSRLKLAIGQPIDGHAYIETVRGQGYVFRRKSPPET